jgi:uncharacterized membrane protein (DUF485 family)
MTLEQQLEELENKVTICSWMMFIPWFLIYKGFLWLNNYDMNSNSAAVNTAILVTIQWIFIILSLVYIAKRRNVKRKLLIEQWKAVLKQLEKEVDNKEKTDKV